MATTIDVLGLAEDLEKAGFSRDQALGMARAIRDHAHETLSKADLGLRLEARFSQVEQFEQKLTGAQSGLIKGLTGIMVAQAAVIVAPSKLLPGPS